MTDLENGLIEAIMLKVMDNPALNGMKIQLMQRAQGGGFVVLAQIRGDNWGCWLTDLSNPASLCSGVYGSEWDCRAMMQRRLRKAVNHG